MNDSLQRFFTGKHAGARRNRAPGRDLARRARTAQLPGPARALARRNDGRRGAAVGDPQIRRFADHADARQRPVQLLVVEATSEQTLRATAKWDGELENGNVTELLGAGRFVISIVPSNGKQSYQGIVTSKAKASRRSSSTTWQNPNSSRPGYGSLRTRSRRRGCCCRNCRRRQARMPTRGIARPAWGETIKPEELLALPAPEIIRRLYHQEDVRVFEPRPVAFRCSCSHERVTSMLRMLGHEEVRSIIEERGNVEVDCEFCGGITCSTRSMPSRCSQRMSLPVLRRPNTRPEPQRAQRRKGRQTRYRPPCGHSYMKR